MLHIFPNIQQCVNNINFVKLLLFHSQMVSNFILRSALISGKMYFLEGNYK